MNRPLWKQYMNHVHACINQNPCGSTKEYITRIPYLNCVSGWVVHLFFTFINNIQPTSSTFFSTIGKPKIGTFLALTRQIIFLLPLLVIFPLFMGIDGIMYAGPSADLMAAMIAGFFLIRQVKQLNQSASN